MKIYDRQTAETWLSHQNQKTIAAFAARNSLRAMSAIQFVSTSSDDLARFFILRSTLIACVSAGEHSQVTANKLARAAQYAADALRSELRTTASMDNSSAISAGRIALNAVQIAAAQENLIEKSAATAITWAESYVTNTYAAANRDAQLLTQIGENSQPASDVFKTSLWPSLSERNHAAAEPAGHVKAYERVIASMDKETAVWSFWQRWWEGMRTGTPLPWELQAQVALIGGEDSFKIWGESPRTVAEKIREVEARLELKARLREAETAMVRDAAQRLKIGGNNPPGAIDDFADWPNEVTLVWEPLVAFKEEADSEEPDKDRIRGAIGRIQALLFASGKWLGGKLDTAVDAAAKEFGKLFAKWSTRIGAVWLAAQAPHLEGILKAAEAWLRALGG